ncbi:MAG: hypothetical protein KDK48_00895 [Chlamydiia bacterium]|nr:hypothetical protein [Chlamydiia bacterium]
MGLAAKEEKRYCFDERLVYGNRFKQRCRVIYDEYGYYLNPKGIEGYYFVKTQYVEHFFKHFCPEENFVLITHNSDHSINERHLPLLETKNLVAWLAVNVDTHHPKLKAIPIGLCNFANFDTFHEVMQSKADKTTLVYANYTIYTNPIERRRCLQLTGVPLAKQKPFREVCKDVASSYFVISPEGNGIDCHRTWEALYLGAIPIVTKSPHTEAFKGLPILIIDSWKEYKNLELTKELYDELWESFTPEQLDFESFFQIL